MTGCSRAIGCLHVIPGSRAVSFSESISVR